MQDGVKLASGRRWIGDSRFADFWGLKLAAMAVTTVWLLVFAVPFYLNFRDSNETSLTNDENRATVDCLAEGEPQPVRRFRAGDCPAEGHGC